MNVTATALSSLLQRRTGLTFGMAHLAPRGIAEEWWLKYLGDVHWQLIADAVGQNTTVFRDRNGRQLYAAFCATEFCQQQPDLAQLGKSLNVHSQLWTAGRSRIQSNHRLLVQGKEIASFRLVSTFVAHMEPGVNVSVRRAAPFLVPVLQPAPDDFAIETARRAKAEGRGDQIIENGIVLGTTIGCDFNAVGLLYFPSFTRLMDQSEVSLTGADQWSPVRKRLMLYFGNIEMGEPVWGSHFEGAPDRFALHRISNTKGRHHKIAVCSLKRHCG